MAVTAVSYTHLDVYKRQYYVLYDMFAIILVVMGLFYFGGDAQGDAVLMSCLLYTS